MIHIHWYLFFWLALDAYNDDNHNYTQYQNHIWRNTLKNFVHFPSQLFYELILEEVHSTTEQSRFSLGLLFSSNTFMHVQR